MPRERAKERACDSSIKKTLAYSGVFNYPLSFFQLANFLITRQTFDYGFFKQSLRRLIKSRQIKVKDEKFYFSGIKPLSWDLRLKYSKDLINLHEESLKVLTKIPWIKMIGITGSVAAYNAEKNDDLDIFIVTSKSRIWLTRGFVAAFLIIMKKYPNRKSDSPKICPNIFVDEDHLAWPIEKQNIYTAHEIALLQPIYSKDDIYFRFLNENRWMREYLPYFVFEIPKRIKGGFEPKSILVTLAEKLAMNFEMVYMRSKQTTEVTTRGIIHFNKKDSTQNVLRKYKQFTAKL